jgi:hypothetical protein
LFLRPGRQVIDKNTMYKIGLQNFLKSWGAPRDRHFGFSKTRIGVIIEGSIPVILTIKNPWYGISNHYGKSSYREKFFITYGHDMFLFLTIKLLENLFYKCLQKAVHPECNCF